MTTEAVSGPSSDYEGDLQTVARALADRLTEQWLAADLIAEADDLATTALAARIDVVCAEIRALSSQLHLLGETTGAT